MGWEPKNKSGFAFFLLPTIARQPEGQQFALPPGIEAFVASDSYSIIAVGNIDDDPDLEIWQATSDKGVTELHAD